MTNYIAWLDGSTPLTAREVGGKGASLARLAAAGFPVPPGFAVTADAYRHFHRTHDLDEHLPAVEALSGRPPMVEVRTAVTPIRERVTAARLPIEVREAILQAYERLQSQCTSPSTFAVRSSGASEDGAAASFAGLYESYLNLSHHEDVAKAVYDCYTCLWEPRAVHYRTIKGIGHRNEAMAVVVMQTVHSHVSGVAFTRHPVTGAEDEVLINSSWGLGEAIVSGSVTPDNFVVKKSGQVSVRDISRKEVRVVPVPGGTLQEPVPAEDASRPSLSDEQVKHVASMAQEVEAHYGMPMDIEFAFDAGGRFFLLQARPITTH